MRFAAQGSGPHWWCLTVAAATVLAFCGLAGTHAQQTPTFRAGVELVRLDVVVTDSNDRPVTTLTAEDFEIVERGRQQAVAEFAYISIPVLSRDEPTVPTGLMSAPDVATNTEPPDLSRLFVIVVDDLHVIETDIVALKRFLTSFVRTLSDDDLVSVVFVSRSDLSLDFTSDTSAVQQAIEHISETVGFGQGARSPGLDYMHQVRSTTFVLRNVTKALADVAHRRRVLVYVSDGVTIDPGAPPCLTNGPGGTLNCSNPENAMAMLLREELADVFDSAAQAGVPIYTVDPRGVATPETAVRGPVFGNVRNIWRRIRVQQNYLVEIAEATGGRAFVNRSNLDDVAREIALENGSYYLLGYYPDPYVGDGNFRSVDVRVRRPGLRVRARKGYVALDPTAAPPLGKPSLDKILGSARPGGRIPLRAFAAPLTRAAHGTWTAVLVDALYPPQATVEAVSDGVWLSVLAVDPDGRVLAESHQTFTVDLPRAGDRPRVLALGDLLDLPFQDVMLRIGVASRLLNETATVYLPLEVPDLSAGALSLGGVVIGAAQTLGASAATPQLRAALPFQPVLRRDFSAHEQIEVFVSLMWDTQGGVPELSVAILGESQRRAGEVSITSSGSAGRETAGTAVGRLSLAGLNAGQYTLEVEARARDGQESVRRVPLRIR